MLNGNQEECLGTWYAHLRFSFNGKIDGFPGEYRRVSNGGGCVWLQDKCVSSSAVRSLVPGGKGRRRVMGPGSLHSVNVC